MLQHRHLNSKALQGRHPIAGSYHDRNQMESKVVRPLVAAFRQYTEGKLNLIVSGKLGTNFSVIFKPAGLKIGLVDER